MLFKRFITDQTGGDAAEYALIGALLLSGIVTGGTLFANSLGHLFQWVAATVTGVL